MLFRSLRVAPKAGEVDASPSGPYFGLRLGGDFDFEMDGNMLAPTEMVLPAHRHACASWILLEVDIVESFKVIAVGSYNYLRPGRRRAGQGHAPHI